MGGRAKYTEKAEEQLRKAAEDGIKMVEAMRASGVPDTTIVGTLSQSEALAKGKSLGSAEDVMKLRQLEAAASYARINDPTSGTGKKMVDSILKGEAHGTTGGTFAVRALGELAEAGDKTALKLAGDVFKAVVKRAPVIGGLVVAGSTLAQAGENISNGEYGKAGTEVLAGTAEAVATFFGGALIGGSDAAREVVRGATVATLGEKYAPEKSGLRTLGEAAYGALTAKDTAAQFQASLPIVDPMGNVTGYDQPMTVTAPDAKQPVVASRPDDKVAPKVAAATP